MFSPAGRRAISVPYGAVSSGCWRSFTVTRVTLDLRRLLYRRGTTRMVRMGSLVQARQGVHKAPQNGPSFSDGSNAPDVGFDHQLAETKTP
jgi:hypothetical protein